MIGTADAPLIAPTGFREYDARWLWEREIDAAGMRAVGLALAELVHRRGRPPRMVVGHDYRAYSGAVRNALVGGLVEGGLTVVDIGLALTPMAYLARERLDAPALAMITASHNPNGWTGVKMGLAPPFTLLPPDVAELRDLALAGTSTTRPGGLVEVVDGFADTYADAVVGDIRLPTPLRVVCACGNGTAGAFAPAILRRLGCEVVEMDCTLDWTFPRHDPNPEDPGMQCAIAEAVLASGAALGFGFDGDGDRLGVIDDAGRPIHADHLGLLTARSLAAAHPGATFVVDGKSTGLFDDDPVLSAHGARVIRARTGHSYMKRALADANALAGFEKSGHVFHAPPLGRGYDDALIAAREVLRMVDAAPGRSLAALRRTLPPVFASSTLAARCADTEKYGVVARIVATLERWHPEARAILGRGIRRLGMLGGARLELDDGSWLLIRASSNTPEIVVVVESRRSEADRDALFREVAQPLIDAAPEVEGWRLAL